MLAELAAANAAFAIVKKAVQNSGELMHAGEALINYFDSKAAIQVAINKKAKPGQPRRDLEEFMALEQLAAQEAKLRELMQWTGRAGLWDDWLKFQAKAAHRRAEEQQAAIRKAIRIRERRIEGFWWVVLIVLVAGSIYFSAVIYDLITERQA